MKNKFLLAMTILSLSTLSSCGARSNRISLFLYDDSDTFITSLRDAIFNEMKPEFDIDMVNYAEINQTIQNEQIVKELEKNKPSLMIVNIVDRLAASSIIEKAKLSNTPVIFINREPLLEDLEGSNNIFYVGVNPTKEGELQGKLANQIFNGKDQFLSKHDRNHDKKLGVIALKGSMGHQDSELRIKNSLLTLKKSGYDVDLLSVKYCEWNRAIAKEEFALDYSEFDERIDLVLSANDDMALGAIDYLKTLYDYIPTLEIKEQYFPVVGNDATNVAKESIKKGQLSGTIVNDANEQAKAIKGITKVLLSDNPNDWSKFEYKFENGHFIYIPPKTYLNEE